MTEPENQAEALKPCPFCGGTFVAQGASRDYISVWCGNCGARGPEVKFPENCMPGPPVDECRAAWNRRAALPEAPAVPVGAALLASRRSLTRIEVDSPPDAAAERDIYEVANQLAGYVDDETPQRLADFLMRESEHASGLADEIVRLRFALQSTPPVKAVDGEIDRLRKALIAAGRHVGAGLADDVSTDFLMLVPEEVRLVMEQHRAALSSSKQKDGGE